MHTIQELNKQGLSRVQDLREGRELSGSVALHDHPAGQTASELTARAAVPAEVVQEHGAKVRTLLRKTLGEDVFTSWFNALEFDSFDGSKLQVSVPVDLRCRSPLSGPLWGKGSLGLIQQRPVGKGADLLDAIAEGLRKMEMVSVDLDWMR